MSIANRNLKAGQVLAGKHKGKAYTCTVKSTKDGLRFVVEGIDGEFKMPSGAGAAVFGKGRTCNGWAFWRLGQRGRASQ
jgi:hypothetical protein